MLKLEDIKPKAQIVGLIPGEIATVKAVDTIGKDAIGVYFKTPDGALHERLLYRDDEASLEMAKSGLAWSFDSPSHDFKLALEALRIQMGFAFDPMMAVHTSNIEPLPHQLSAVYEAMLPKQPLRFVLADDPGAGKTIMAGLLVKELLMRADAQRVLIVAPGSLTEQWQDEMRDKFDLEFKIFSRELQEHSSTGNYFAEEDLLIARLDQLARSEELQLKLQATQWDLVIIDEAHKLSAHYFGNKAEKTQRYRLGELLGSKTRHLLLMTATPHNGKDADFQLWLALLDADRFYGESRDGARLEVSDVMRRLVKEELLKFDGTRLFPERLAYTLNYKLSDAEAALYAHVTQYVCEEMNRADDLDGQRRHQVGFALTMLQRRLASSPAAIHQSLRRRRERLERQLREKKAVARGQQILETDGDSIAFEKKVDLPADWDDLEDELTPEEYEGVVDKIIDRSTAANTAAELEKEIASLRCLETEAEKVVQSGVDCKWQKLSEVLQGCPEMHDANGRMRKLIIFTEHRDTLDYLAGRIAGLLGGVDAIRTIHGGTNRDVRKKIQEEFCNNPDVVVLVATDAAGEGVNLQKSNLMVNYDLPWNPNRLEQRFGRIHRIGQTETCHLWNLVAGETREGDVFQTLFAKLEMERKALGGRVFDILGEIFEGNELKDLIVEAIRRGQMPGAKDWMTEKVASAMDTERLKEIIRRNTLVEQAMTPEMLYAIRDEMDMAEARKLQPCFVRAFFKAAFEAVGGELRQREAGRFEIPNVPSCIRENHRVVATNRLPIARKYSRICFEKSQVRPAGSNEEATLIHPGHPLMHSLTNYILLEKRQLLKPGTVMVDPTDEGTTPSLLFMVDHRVCEGEAEKLVSRRMQFVRLLPDGTARNAGWAPHLDLQEPSAKALELAKDIRSQAWLAANLESVAIQYASANLAKEHFDDVSKRRIAQVDKIHQAVRERLSKAINYWTGRMLELEQAVAAGKQPRVQPANARQTAEMLTARLQNRERELEQMRHIVSKTPVVLGGILVIPQGLLNQATGTGTFCADAEQRKHVEQVAMKAVMDLEQSFGNDVTDVSALKCGWDVTSRYPVRSGEPIRNARHIEVKGRAKGAETITVTRNEICYAINQRDKFILAIVLVDGDSYEGPYYIRNPFEREPDLDDVSINKDIALLLRKAVPPEQTLS
ncbi:MAG: DEAD/DEAH box helicase family protein [Victivallales bacterium]|nr:DEAD/DEAH box helicase family protein [Victivallales bacterium]